MELNQAYTVGQLVRASYKSGEYIGELVEITPSGKAAVKIAAVVKHPTQGDLHHPMNPDVPFFHERRALSFQEIALIPLNTLKPFHGSVPEYGPSLKLAFEREIELLDRTRRWAERSLAELEKLREEYQ